VVRLLTADYTVEGMEGVIAVERKATVHELALSFAGETFAGELERLARLPAGAVICEFSERDIRRYPQHANIPGGERTRTWLQKRGIDGAWLLSQVACAPVPFIYAGGRGIALRTMLGLFRVAWNAHNTERIIL
jgi:hypothetical protein